MERMIEAAKKLIKQRKVKKISRRDGLIMYEVGGRIVRIFKKPGRTLVTCSCEHHARFCNSPTVCKHKLCVYYKIMKNGTRRSVKNFRKK